MVGMAGIRTIHRRRWPCQFALLPRRELPCPRAIQQLVQAWKQLRRWRKGEIVLCGERMSEKQNEAVLSIFPANATTGALSVFVRPGKVEEIKKLEEERTPKMWEVRAYLSDHAVLAGTPF